MADMISSKRKWQWELKQESRNWVDLPIDVMINILLKISFVDILENVQKVCTTWYHITKDPAIWKIFHMKNLKDPFNWRWRFWDRLVLFKQAVDRSQGELVDMTFVEFSADELLQETRQFLAYVADRSSKLRRLELVCRYYGSRHWGLTESLKKFPLLEELNLYHIKVSKEIIESVGRCCRMLTTLKVNKRVYMFYCGVNNEIAIAIGENLLGLKHLELIGNNMSNSGLQVILDGCRHLESLDLRKCLYIDLKGDMGKKCLDKIKTLKLPKQGSPYLYDDDFEDTAHDYADYF